MTISRSKTVLFEAIQFSISTQFSSIWPIYRTLLVSTTLGLSGLGIDANEGVLHIPQISGITGTKPSDCLVSCPGHSMVVVVVGLLPLTREVVGVFYSPSRLSNLRPEGKEKVSPWDQSVSRKVTSERRKRWPLHKMIGFFRSNLLFKLLQLNN